MLARSVSMLPTKGLSPSFSARLSAKQTAPQLHPWCRNVSPALPRIASLAISLVKVGKSCRINRKLRLLGQLLGAGQPDAIAAIEQSAVYFWRFSARVWFAG